MSLTRDEGCTADPSLDPTIDALASWRRRCALYYFLVHDDEAASVDDVGEFVCRRTPTETDRASEMTALYHQALPKLDQIGLIEFDERSETIRVKEFGQWKPVVESIRSVESQSPSAEGE